MSGISQSKPLRKRDRLRGIKEAEEAIVVCESAISRAPDDSARAVFERSQRIWRKRLDALKFGSDRAPGVLTVLCVRTRVIGTGNSFEVLIPLSEISAVGQNYRILRDGREFVPFHLGIEPYTSSIIKMPPGFERYDAYKAHEKASKAKELSILQHAFPENHLTETPFLWNRDYLADRQVTLRVDRLGNLIRPMVRNLRPSTIRYPSPKTP
jgi:hypothetical protein